MATLSRSDAVIALGRALVRSLRDRPSTLSTWMAHYIAERLDDADAAGPVEREAKQAAAFEAILELWRHRSELPDGARPYQALEPVIATLKRLDPDTRTFWFFRDRDFEEVTRTKGIQADWLRLAVELDDEARAAIRFCLAAAIETVAPEAKEFAELAHLAFEADDDRARLRHIILTDRKEPPAADPGAARTQKALDRVASLQALLADLEIRLQSRLADHRAGAAGKST
jgi:hypothetical protein